MLRDSVAVIDVGSSKISGLIGENGVNDNFVIRAYDEVASYCIDGGSIPDPNEFKWVVEQTFKRICQSAKAKVTKVYFGVPSAFLLIRNCSHSVTLPRRKRLNRRDVDEYITSSLGNLAVPGYEMIRYSGVQYFLDGQTKTTRLTGAVTSSVKGLTTFFFAKNAFVRSVREVMSGLGVREVAFIPVPLAESLLLFDGKERFAFEILVDVGAVTTDFSIIFGGGVLFNKCFESGGAFISRDLVERFNLPETVHGFSLAEKLKRKLNLTIPPDRDGLYEVTDGNDLYKFPQKMSNETAIAYLTELAQEIDNAITESNVRIPDDMTISLTGGGITYVRGATDYLFKTVEMPFNVVYPKTSYMAKPEETSKMALLNFALNDKGV